MTLSGVIYKNHSKRVICKKSRTETGNKYLYGEKSRFLGDLKQAYVQAPIEVLGMLHRMRVSRQAVVLAMLLHRQADMRRWPVVRLPIALLNQCGFDRRTVSRALQQLEHKDLIRVHRNPGKRSTVTVLWHPIREFSFVADEDEEEEEE